MSAIQSRSNCHGLKDVDIMLNMQEGFSPSKDNYYLLSCLSKKVTEKDPNAG
jgi:hypothetical protein